MRWPREQGKILSRTRCRREKRKRKADFKTWGAIWLPKLKLVASKLNQHLYQLNVCVFLEHI